MHARTLLGLDTSTLSISLAVVRVDGGGSTWKVLSHGERGPGGPNHSTLLPLWIDELLVEAGVKLGELDGIAVGLGPGSFTGLRIALATAKGLAYAARLPLAGASTLEAMALQASRIVPEAAAIVPLLDARKQEVYAGFYRPSGGWVEPLDDGAVDVVDKPEAIAARISKLKGPVVLLGEGYFAYRSLFDEATEGQRAPQAVGLAECPPAAEVAVLAARELRPFDKESVFALEPRYIRSGDAEYTPPKPRI